MKNIARAAGAWAVVAAVAVAGYFLLAALPVSLSMVRSPSMVPEYHPGDFVIVAEGAEYTPGDVVVFTPEVPGATLPAFAHRVINIENGVVQTKGDANETADAFETPTQNVSGKVVGVIPTKFLAHPYTPTLAGSALGALVALTVYTSVARRWTQPTYVGKYRA